mmetsp:Transcript_60386/g.127963  ORF Transcript_60386/g.127963 Transcript_60386/m.127963 type:complete len:303 (+) Transcript_60386:108-1016(+)
MSWYISLDGRQVWVENNTTVLTVGEAPPEKALPLEHLAYLAATSSKAVYAEHIIEDELGDKRKKTKEKGGKQRGYVVRVEGDTRTRVMGSIQAAVDYLTEREVISRVDIDDSEKPKGRKSKNKDNMGKKKAEGEEEEEVVILPIATNECRVEIKARVSHFAHGRGFKVHIEEPGTLQRLHLFTPDQEMSAKDFHKQLVDAIQKTGGATALTRMAGDLDPPSKPKDEAQAQEDDWLESLMGSCMVAPKAKKKEPKEDSPTGDADENSEKPKKDEEEGTVEVIEDKDKTTTRTRTRAVPPWLRR